MGWLIFLAVLFVIAVPLGIMGVSIWGIYRGVRALGSHISSKLLGKGTAEAPHEPGAGPRAPQQEAEYEVEEPVRPNRREKARPRRADSSAHVERNMRDFEYLDVERGATPSHISQVMRSYVDDYVVGEYAQSVIDSLASAEFRRKSLLPEIESKFEPGTISWERFMRPAKAAVDVVVSNCALLANRVQSFDSVDYANMEEFYKKGGFDANGHTDKARLQRWKLLYDAKREMDELRSRNDALLLELGKLAMELGRLSSNVSNDESARIAEELNELTNDTKLYQ